MKKARKFVRLQASGEKLLACFSFSARLFLFLGKWTSEQPAEWCSDEHTIMEMNMMAGEIWTPHSLTRLPTRWWWWGCTRLFSFLKNKSLPRKSISIFVLLKSVIWCSSDMMKMSSNRQWLIMAFPMSVFCRFSIAPFMNNFHQHQKRGQVLQTEKMKNLK